jgi:hypothetical protein
MNVIIYCRVLPDLAAKDCLKFQEVACASYAQAMGYSIEKVIIEEVRAAEPHR